jgi:hypothetical protein
MKFIRQITSKVKSMIDVSSSETINLKGYLPPSSNLASIVDQLVKSKVVSLSIPLNRHLSLDKRNHVVVLWCQGEPKGFLCKDFDSIDSSVLLPDSWWQVDSDRNVYLFAYACHSSTFLLSSDITDYLVGCMGYERDLFFWFGSDSAKAFWMEFLTMLVELLHNTQAIDMPFSAQIQQLYAAFLLEKSKHVSADKAMRLNLACLNRQLENIKFIQGGRLWIDITKL